MRFGQKGRVCHRWFTRGQRPPGLCDRRCTWAHPFAAVRPATGDSFALVMPRVSTEATRALFLDRFSAALAPDERAAMAVDGAGWHVAHAPRIPGDVTPVPLPPHSPGSNPVERVWLFLRERHLSHRLLAGHDAIVDALRTARNALTPDRPPSLTRYPYLNQVKF